MAYWTWLPLFWIGLVASSPAKNFEPFAGPQPIAVLVQQDPWAVVIGADTPRIAIYENGDVIYARDFPHQKRTTYFRAKLGFDGLSSVINQLADVADLKELKPSYSMTDATDQGSALIYLRVDNKEVATSVYGLNPDSLKDAPKTANGGLIPIKLLQLYEYLQQVEFSDSAPWRPDYVEAMIWPYDYAPDESIIWPKDWPDLHSPRAVQRDHGWSIFLDDSMENALAKFLATQKEKGAVEINGQKWSLAYRPVFPSEPVWRKAFSSLSR